MDCFQRNIYQDSRSRYRKTVLQQPVFFVPFFDALPFNALGETFPGRQKGAVFDGRPDIVWGLGGVVKNRGDIVQRKDLRSQTLPDFTGGEGHLSGRYRIE